MRGGQRTDLVAIVERLAMTHGPHVPLAELRRAAGLDELEFRATVLALAKAGRVQLLVDATPRLVDADTIDRSWYLRTAGEVRYVAVVEREREEDGLALLGADAEEGQRFARIAFLLQLHEAVLPRGRRRWRGPGGGDAA